MSFKIEWKSNGVVAVFQGNTHMDDINQASETIYTDSQFKNCSYQLFDFDLADLSQITLDEVRNLSLTDTEVSSGFPKAALVVVAHQPIAGALIFHYRTMVEAQNMTWKVKLFHTTDEALEWCSSIA